MTKADLAREYRARHGWDMPTLKLARILYQDHNLSFRNVEGARDALRYIEGKSGNKAKTYSTTVQVEERPKNPYKLPESDETSYEPYRIQAKRVLVLSDIHIPYHSIDALNAAFVFAEAEKPDAILLNGDTIDFHGLSRFVKNPKARSFAHELEAFSNFFDILKSIFDCKIYFKLGNHEERYDNFLIMKAHELHGVKEFKLEEIIKSRAEGIEVISDKKIVKLGGLNVVHGHEFGNSIFSPVNVAKGLFNKGSVSAMQGHNHQTSEHTNTDMNREMTTTWSLGCLCGLSPAFLPINRWNNGFAIVDLDDQKFYVRNLRIDKGEIR